MRLHHLCLILLNVFGINNGQKNVRIRALKSQQNVPIAWNKYNYIIVGSKGSKDASETWGAHISEKENIPRQDICAIASVPKWLTKTPGSKYVIQKSIYLFENKIPIYIDWEENLQNQTTYICIRLFLLYARTHTQTTLLK